MTESDRARLWQIAAYGLSHGETASAVEKRLLDYARELPDREIADALFYGRAAIAAGQALQRGNVGLARALTAGIPGMDPANLQAYVTIRTGPGPDDWRSQRVTVPSNLPDADVLGELRRRTAEQLATRHGSPVSSDEGETLVEFFGPSA